MLELLAVTLVVVSIGLYLRLRELERRMHIFDKWADWLEEQVFGSQEITLTLEGDNNDEGQNK